jgi:peptide subunit release factor 1 (eRF1)
MGRASQPGKISALREFVQSEFQDKSITESVTEIVDRSKEPIGAKDVMAQLYEGLSDGDYQRAKNSVTNVLSVGRTKGKWKSIGRGLYVSNAVAT